MAFLATENFDSYTNGDDINGKSGGSGWTTNWASGAGAAVTNAQFQSSPNSLLPAAGTNPSRDFTNVTVGSHSWYFRYNGTSGIVRYYNSGNLLIAVRTDSGNVEIYNGASYVSIGSQISDSWMKVTIEVDQVAQPYKYRASLNDGTFSSWISRNLDETATGVDRWLSFEGIYYDTIAPVADPGPANLKSLDTNVKANIKSYNTNVLANIKSINTNA